MLLQARVPLPIYPERPIAFREQPLQALLRFSELRRGSETSVLSSQPKQAGGIGAASPVFRNSVSAPPDIPRDLTGMPAICLCVPEPSVLGLAAGHMPVHSNIRRLNR